MEGSLSESGYEPEDEAKEGSRKNEVSPVATAIPRNPNRTGNSRVMLSAHREKIGQDDNIKNPFLSHSNLGVKS